MGKSKLKNDYINQKNITKKKLYPTTLNLYEYSEVTERKKDIGNHHYVIILLDITNRQSFEDILDIWIKF